ncbi:T9SS type A sorting domain-containing protein [uncultured Polaribacter sp.]|uniref:T9SS type A sorting domain-containing protein n=1 Tax=uncultured Polaribacter sp. TaxID=174711 RepID=UPI0026193544|nr:T9SS type A sorting domain-containing protein [uncultured Polaribacter sp.]
MKKRLFLNLTFLLFTIGIFAQSSGSFSGTLVFTDAEDIFSFTSTGNGTYNFTGTYTGNGNWISSVAYIGSLNNYNIGNVNGSSGSLSFSTGCVESGQTINLLINASVDTNESFSYQINYQFTPMTYSTNEIEPNDTFAQAINTIENTNYEGWFNLANGQTENDSDDWYKFTSPRNGKLSISVINGGESGGTIIPNLYNSNNLNQIITPTSFEQNGNTNIRVFNNFNFENQEFGIELGGNCLSYQMSWKIEDNTLDIEKYSLENSIKLFPNPVSNSLSVTINNNLNIEKVEIIEITGKLIKKTNLINNSISTQNLKSGIYFVKIHSDKGIITKKIIKSE